MGPIDPTHGGLRPWMLTRRSRDRVACRPEVKVSLSGAHAPLEEALSMRDSTYLRVVATSTRARRLATTGGG